MSQMNRFKSKFMQNFISHFMLQIYCKINSSTYLNSLCFYGFQVDPLVMLSNIQHQIGHAVEDAAGDVTAKNKLKSGSLFVSIIQHFYLNTYINAETIIFFMSASKIEVAIIIENTLEILCQYDLKSRHQVCLVCFYFLKKPSY